MNFVLEPVHLLLAILAGWVNRQQQQQLDYVITEKGRLLVTSRLARSYRSANT